MTPGNTITTIPVLPFGMVNAFLLRTVAGAILIDTGLPGSEKKVELALRANGLGWSDLKLIVVTHGHIDHAGAAKRIQALSGAPVLLHEQDRAYCLGTPPLLKPTGIFGRLFLLTGAIEEPFETFEPNIVLTDGKPLDLREFGVSGYAMHTPGHTPGSLSVLLEDGVAFAGDLAASGILLGGLMFRKQPKRPPFEETPHEAATSLELLLAKGATTFYVGHGGPLNMDIVRRHIKRLATLGPG